MNIVKLTFCQIKRNPYDVNTIPLDLDDDYELHSIPVNGVILQFIHLL